MSDFIEISIKSEAEFLAHIIALKNESEERLQTMADCLDTHNNPLAAEVFQELSEFITDAISQLEEQARDFEIPEIPPWEFQWHCADNPENQCMDHAHYMMSAREALKLAFFNEQRSLNFLKQVHDASEHSGVRVMAMQQIGIEERFAELIQQRLEDLPDDEIYCDDLDPPNEPE